VDHVDTITKRASQTLNFVRRNFSTCPFHIREHCYTTLVCPQLEYASSVWDNNIQCNINKLESVQRRAARFVCHDYRQTSSVTSMLQRLSWDSLQQRRAHNRVWMLYRIRNGLVAIPPDHLKQTTVATRRHETRHMQIRCNSCTVCTARHSFQAQSDYGTVYLQIPATSHLTASSWSCRRLISSDHAPSFYLAALHDFIS